MTYLRDADATALICSRRHGLLDIILNNKKTEMIVDKQQNSGEVVFVRWSGDRTGLNLDILGHLLTSRVTSQLKLNACCQLWKVEACLQISCSDF